MTEAENEFLTFWQLLMVQTATLMDLVNTWKLSGVSYFLLVNHICKVSLNKCLLYSPFSISPKEAYEQVVGWRTIHAYCKRKVRWTWELGRCWIQKGQVMKEMERYQREIRLIMDAVKVKRSERHSIQGSIYLNVDWAIWG